MSDAKILVGGVAVLLLGAWYVSSRAAGAVSDAAQAVLPYVNPADPRNFAYTAVNAVGEQLSGDSGWTLGTSLYDLSRHPLNGFNLYDQAVSTVRPYVDPTNQGNIINRGVNSVGEIVTGNKDWTLGTAVYDWWNN